MSDDKRHAELRRENALRASKGWSYYPLVDELLDDLDAMKAERKADAGEWEEMLVAVSDERDELAEKLRAAEAETKEVRARLICAGADLMDERDALAEKLRAEKEKTDGV